MPDASPHLIQTAGELEKAIQLLKNDPLIGLDTEFIRETSFFPRIALIQLSGRDRTFLIDPTVLGKDELLPLLDLLEDERYLKVIHASHSDQECLFWTYGKVAKPVLDTSVAAALCGMGDSIGLQKLLREVLGVHVSKGRARAKWLARPLTHELLHYAEQDVAHLVPLCEKLKEMLDRHRRWEWALEESGVEPSIFEISPQDLASKMAKGAHLEGDEAILTELITWRENRAKEANLPRGWIASNDILIALARSQPKSVEELKTFRGIHSKEIDRSGAKILEAIEKGRGKSGQRPAFSKRETPRVDPHVINLLETYVSFLAAREEIMPRYLMNSHQKSQILFHLEKSIEEWVKLGVLTSHAADLIGEDLKALFSGQRALRVDNKQLKVVDLV